LDWGDEKPQHKHVMDVTNYVLYYDQVIIHDVPLGRWV